MFNKTAPSTAPSLFSSLEQVLSGRKRELLMDPGAWQNVFFREVTSRIDEGSFGKLYDQGMGRPNSSIRLLVAMCILKEGMGCSDEQLFGECQLNMLCMRAIGLNNVDDDIPATSTYYLFRKKVSDHMKVTGKDLFLQCFRQITHEQVIDLHVDGKRIRMDTKLVGSNIARSCLLRLVIECIQQFYKSLSEAGRKRLTPQQVERLNTLATENADNIVYRTDKQEQLEMVEELGTLIGDILSQFDDDDTTDCDTLRRLWNSHFKAEDGHVSLRPAKEIPADAIQSAHDTDAAYVNRNGTKASGYRVNITETCTEGQLNLITDVQVDKANRGDQTFMKPAIEGSTQVAGTVEDAFMDGGFQSPENDMAEVQIHYSGIQGPRSRWRLIKGDQGMQVTDARTGVVYEAVEYKPGHYRIKISSENEHSNYVYFRPEAVRAALIREQTGTGVTRNVRANVEATIFQLSCYLRGKKSKYRGLANHRAWAVTRCIWINFRRIRNHLHQPITPGSESSASSTFGQFLEILFHPPQTTYSISLAISKS